MAAEEFALRMGVRDAEAREDVRSFVNLLQGMSSQLQQAEQNMQSLERMSVRTGRSFQELTGRTESQIEAFNTFQRTVGGIATGAGSVFSRAATVGGRVISFADRAFTAAESSAFGTSGGFQPGGASGASTFFPAALADTLALRSIPIVGPVLPSIVRGLAGAAGLPTGTGDFVQTGGTSAAAQREATLRLANEMTRLQERENLSDLDVMGERTEADIGRSRQRAERERRISRELQEQLRQLGDVGFRRSQQLEQRQFEETLAAEQDRFGGFGFGTARLGRRDRIEAQREAFAMRQRFAREGRALGQDIGAQGRAIAEQAQNTAAERANTDALEDLSRRMEELRTDIKDNTRAQIEANQTQIFGGAS